MAYAHFLIPAEGGEAEQRFQKFIDAHAILKVEQRFVERSEGLFWCYAVHYDSGPPRSNESTSTSWKKRELGKDRIDYEKELSPENFALYVKLRDWRAEAATEAAIPVFSIFHNATLAEITKKRPKNIKELQEIPKVGEGKAEKYGGAVLELVNPKP